MSTAMTLLGGSASTSRVDGPAATLAELRSALGALRSAPLLSKAAYAERVAELSLAVLEDIGRRLAALELSSHPPIDGLCKSVDVDHALDRLDHRISRLESRLHAKGASDDERT